MSQSVVNSAFLADPYPTYHALRAAGPIHWCEDFCGGAWLLTNYADVASVLRDPRLSAQRAGGWANRSGPQASLVAVNEYFRAILPERRRHLGEDLVSLLIRAEEDGRVITTKELLAQCSMLLFAGHETTRNLLGNGLLALLKHPGQWRLLKE